MVQSPHSRNNGSRKNGNKLFSNGKNGGGNNGQKNGQYKKLATMGKVSVDIINELYNPIDATNRFINLALQSIEEDSQGRQFLLESKSGIRRMSSLLERLDKYARKLEKEIAKALEANA